MTTTETDAGMPLLTVEEAAERLGVDVRFVRRLIAERRIRYFKIGRHVRLAAGDLDEFVVAAAIDPRARAAADRCLWMTEIHRARPSLP